MASELKNWLAILVAFIALTKFSEARTKSKLYVWEEDEDYNEIERMGIDDGLGDDEISGQNTCAHDIHCQERRWGHHSRCNQKTAKCECHDQDWSFRETVRSKDGTCIIRKRVGDPCNTHKECEPIPGEAYCEHGHYDSSSGKYRYKGSCRCKETSTWYNQSGKCLLKARKLGDPCEFSGQCRDGTLGRLSTCDRDTGKCACMNFGGALNNTQTIYYEMLKKCFIKKEYNDACTEGDECRASLGPDVKCGITEYLDMNVCHCPLGIVCQVPKVFSPKLIAGIVVTVIVIVAICIAICYCCRIRIRAKIQNKIGPVIRKLETAGNDSTASKLQTAHVAHPVVAIPNNHNVGSQLHPVKESISATVPLLQQNQPVKYSYPPPLMNFIHPSTNGPQPHHHPQSFELSRLYPRLPTDTELSSFPKKI